MKYEIAATEDNVVVSFSDDLSFDDHDQFRNVLNALDQKKCKRCVFDLDSLKSVDSAGLGMLMFAYRKAQENAWSLVLRRPQGQVLRMLEITELSKVIPVE